MSSSKNALRVCKASLRPARPLGVNNKNMSKGHKKYFLLNTRLCIMLQFKVFLDVSNIALREEEGSVYI